jgi:hypothetical protein
MGSFDSLPFPMQRMLFQQMRDQQQARQQAGGALYDMFPQEQAPQPQPRPGPALPAPPPGSMSPGGGNPQAMGAPQQNPMAPGGGSVMAPPPQAQAQPVSQPQPSPLKIAPFRPMPSQPPQMNGAPVGEVPPPPQPQAPAADPSQPKPFDLKSIIGGLRKSGVPSEKVMDMLDQLTPVMSAANRAELDQFKVHNQALKAANDAYAKVIQAQAAQQRAATGVRAEDRREDQGQQKIDINADKEKRLKASAAAAAGGAGFLKTTELIYPKGADGKVDQTQAPIGVRGVTKTGKIINLDAEGHQVPTLAGGTPKEKKATDVNVKDTVRANIVKSGVTNAIARLDEIEKAHPGGTTSMFFGQSAQNPASRAAYGAGRSMMSGKSQDVDAKWSSMIDEAIPVFTGGLRGSDAFRRFLIEQAPAPGDKPATVKEKMRLFRQNIEGTSKAFFNKYSADPSFWGPGVKPEEVKGGGAKPQGEWKVEKVEE